MGCPLIGASTVFAKENLLNWLLIIFFNSDAADYRKRVAVIDIEVAKDYCSPPTIFGCSENFETVALNYILQNNISFPNNAIEARRLFHGLVQFVEDLEERF